MNCLSTTFVSMKKLPFTQSLRLFLAGVTCFAFEARAENPSFEADRGTYVNKLDRTYGEEHYDIVFYTPGLNFSLFRKYRQATGWEFEFTMSHLELVYDPTDPAVITEIVYEGTTFAQNGAVWEYLNETISTTINGFRYDDAASGNWAEYDAIGRLTSFGVNAVTRGTVTLDGQGRVDEIRNPSNDLVCDLDYHDNGRVSRAANHGGAEVTYTYDNDGNLLEFTDIRGNVTEYEYTAGRLTKKTLPGGIERNFTYNSTYGDLASITDANGYGRFFEYAYDSTFNEFFFRESFSSGQIVEKRYNGERELISVSVNGTVVNEYAYLDDGNRVLVTDGLGNVTEELLTVNGTRQTTLFANGAEELTILDIDDDFGTFRVIRQVDSRGYETLYEYDANNRISEKTEAAGTPYERTMQFTYNAQGKVIEQTLVGDSDMPDITTIFDYDQFGRKVRTTYPEGNTNEVDYDGFNRSVATRDGRGMETTYAYDSVTGDLLSVTNPLSQTTTYTYDFLGRDKTFTNPLNEVTTFEHTLTEWRQIDPLGNVSSMTYNQEGNIASYVGETGIVTRREYDIHGRVIKVIDGNGNETSVEYIAEVLPYDGNAGSVVSKMKYPTFEVVSEYDELLRKVSDTSSHASISRKVEVLGFANGNANLPVVIRDPSGADVTYTYDALGRVSSETRGVGGQQHVTRYSYDDRDLVLEVELPDSTSYSFTYDRNGRLTSQELALGETHTFTYDANDNRLLTTFPSGRRQLNGYDDAARLTSEQFFLASNLGSTPDIERLYTYDAAGMVETISEGGVVIAFTRDGMGRITGESVNHGDGITLSHSQTFHPNGQLSSFTGHDGITYGYSYDSGGLLSTITIPGRGAISYGNYKWMSPQTITYPGGSTREIAYTDFMDVSGIVVSDPASSAFFSETYQRNALEEVGGVSRADGTVAYTYDERRQLTGVSSTSPAYDTESFTYDLNDNRTSDLNTSAYVYNDSNMLTSYLGEVIAYNGDGDVISQTRDGKFYQYGYDAAGRMTSVTVDSVLVANYIYDGYGRRIGKTVDGVMTRYQYSVLGMSAETDAAGNVTKAYGYEVAGYREDQLLGAQGLRPVFMKEGNDYYFFTYDHNYRPRNLFKSNGTVVWSAETTAFGITEVSPGSQVTCNLRLSNQYFDAESGLHNNTNRYYDAELGRYLQTDPLGVSASYNFYGFVANNPISYADPYGLKCAGCLDVSLDANTEQTIFEGGGAEVKLAIKASIKGQACKECCPDGSCRYSGSVGAEISVSATATAKQNKFSIVVCEAGAGLFVEAQVSGSIGCSVSFSCDNDCRTCEGKVQGTLTAGGYAEASCGSVGFEAKAAGAVSVCGKITAKVCSPNSVSFSVSGLKFGGEIFISFTIKSGQKKPPPGSPSNEWKVTLLKAGDC